MAAYDEESAPLMEDRGEEPTTELSMISAVYSSELERPAGDDDVALVAMGESERHDPRRKSTMILDAKEEERLESSRMGRAVLRNLANSILGQFLQVLLLLGCLGVYTFTPEIISYSKQTDRGLTGIVEATGDSKVAPLTRIDREMRLTPENWPDVPKDWRRPNHVVGLRGDS